MNKPASRVSAQQLDHLIATTGHTFTDMARLDRALTHSSARTQAGKDYERMEFLGDRVLGLCVAKMLFDRFPDANEGELSVRLNALVNATTLAEIADELQLGDIIRAGNDVRDLSSERKKNVRADVVEAIIAAIYLEGGLEAAERFIARYWIDRAADGLTARRDAKTELQEWCHRLHQTTPVYTVIAREGPDHEPIFTVKVTAGDDRIAVAHGTSKRLAEQAAATLLLETQGVWPDSEDVS